MKTTVVAVVTSVLAMSACGVTNPAAAGQDISGRYELTTADGARRLPCCTTTDSSGSTATLVAGSLVLDQAVSQDSVATPDGWMPKACVRSRPERRSCRHIRPRDAARWQHVSTVEVSNGRVLHERHEPVPGSLRLGPAASRQLDRTIRLGWHHARSRRRCRRRVDGWRAE